MKKLGEYLVEKGALTLEQLNTALSRQKATKGRLGNILIKLGFIKESELNRLLAEQYHLALFEDDDMILNINVQKSFPKTLIEKFGVIPVKLTDKDFYIGISDVHVLNDIPDITFALGKNVIPILFSDSMHEKVYSDILSHPYGIKDYHFETFDKFFKKRSEGIYSITTLVDSILAFDSGINQILLSENNPPFVKKIRHFYKQSIEQIDRKKLLSFIKELTDEKIRKKLIENGNVYFKKNIGKYFLNFTILKHKAHYTINIKTIPSVVPHFDKLGLDREILKILTNPVKGVYFLVAPLGHGKSMAMGSLLNYYNHEKFLNILSIEEGIQYDIISENSLVTQYEVTAESDSYQKGVKLAYDIDPDILMVSSIPDGKTLELMLDFAESGRPVIVSFESGSIAGAFEKLFSLVDINKKSYLISKFTNLMKVIVNFRMVPVKGIQSKLLVYEYIQNVAKLKKIIKDGSYGFINSQLKGSSDFIPIEKKLADLFHNGTIDLESGENFADDIEMFRKYI